MAVDDLDLEVPGRQDDGPRRAERLRQDHVAADDQPARRADAAARILLDGTDIRDAQPGAAAPRHRLRDPADRAVPAPHRRGQHRHGPGAHRLAAQEGPGPGAGAAHPGRPRPGPGQALPAPAVRRPAAARRRRPGAGGRPAGAADGRAVQRRRPGRPRLAAGPAAVPAGRAAQDDRARHPRHRGGHQGRRPGGAVPAARHAGAARPAGRAARRARRRLRGRLRRLRPRHQAAVVRLHRGPGRSAPARCCPPTRPSPRRWPRASRGSSSPTTAGGRPRGWVGRGAAGRAARRQPARPGWHPSAIGHTFTVGTDSLRAALDAAVLSPGRAGGRAWTATAGCSASPPSTSCAPPSQAGGARRRRRRPGERRRRRGGPRHDVVMDPQQRVADLAADLGERQARRAARAVRAGASRCRSASSPPAGAGSTRRCSP